MRRVLAMVALGAVMGLAPAAAMADDNAQALPSQNGGTGSSAAVTGNDSTMGTPQFGPADGMPGYLQTPVYQQRNP